MLAVVLCSYRLDGFVAALCALNTVVNLALIELFDDRFLRSTAPDIEQGKWHACARVRVNVCPCEWQERSESRTAVNGSEHGKQTNTRTHTHTHTHTN